MDAYGSGNGREGAERAVAETPPWLIRIAVFESVVHLLAPVLDELVFVGGCTTGVFITDPAAGGIRPTKDVDAIVDVTSSPEHRPVVSV